MSTFFSSTLTNNICFDKIYLKIINRDLFLIFLFIYEMLIFILFSNFSNSASILSLTVIFNLIIYFYIKNFWRNMKTNNYFKFKFVYFYWQCHVSFKIVTNIFCHCKNKNWLIKLYRIICYFCRNKYISIFCGATKSLSYYDNKTNAKVKPRSK